MSNFNVSSVIIRRPEQDDWRRVMELLKTANFHRIGGPEMYRFLPENCFVAAVDGVVEGVAGYEVLQAGTAKTTLLVVAPNARGRGIGTALQHQRLDYLRELGVRTLFTNCDDDRVIAWNCRHFGFRPTGRIISKEEPFGRSNRSFWTNLQLEFDPDSKVMLPDLPTTRDADSLVHELADTQVDEELREAVAVVLDAMHPEDAGFLNRHFQAFSGAKKEVSEAALAPLLNEDAWVSDIVEDRRISNCIAYNFDNVSGAIIDEEIEKKRQCLDGLMLERARSLFPRSPNLSIENTGHFWYPPGAYMGWHTNLRTPGWRCYINIADDPDRSFFRYRTPQGGNIVTSWDKTWNVRLFHITPTEPLWHAVYSDTNRFSLGYKIVLT